MVEEEKDVKRAMEFLHECDLLKIEDILPFFPDFVTIDHFKVIFSSPEPLGSQGELIPLIGKDGDDVIDNLPVNSRVQSQ